jgi:predicted DNA binding CopG/RHH family protein
MLIPDSRIDFSDIPESTDAELKRARRVGRPKSGNAKRLIAIRIAPRLLAQIRRLAAKQSKPYQTLIHELLDRAAKGKVARSWRVEQFPPDLVAWLM